VVRYILLYQTTNLQIPQLLQTAWEANMEAAIPNVQRAITVKSPGPAASVEIKTIPVPEPGINDVLIRLSHTGVCHGDISLMYGDWEAVGLRPDGSNIPGHEGVGTIVKVGTNVQNFAIGDRAGIKWIHSTCGTCAQCLTGNDHYCAKQKHFGRNIPGSFQQYVVSPALYTSPIPDGVADEQAGPILCGGVTMYRALKVSRATAGQWVAILGAGGGLGHLGIQYACAMGLRVIAVDGGAEKEALSVSSGAEAFIDYTKVADVPERVLKLTGGVAGVIAAAGNRASYEQGAKMLGEGGTLVCVGLPHEPFDIPFSPLEFIQKGCYVTGTNAGPLQDVQEALQFAVRGQVKVHVETFPINAAEEVFQRLRTNNMRGRAVLELR
jgi:propanol-preferring alcohol dehydrogenase